ncbi:MAG TPA: ATP-binding protein [Xanthobacteraceae bacterium]|nr:ATP-binding protein [Xanthobacteraceae bacterium]
MQPRQDAAIRLLKVLLAASLLLPLALFAYASSLSYRSTFKAADERIDRALEVLHEHALKVFQSVEFTAVAVEDMLRGQSDAEIKRNEENLHARLKKLEEALEVVETIWVIGKGGEALVTSYDYPLPAGLNLADRDYFKAHLGGDVGSYVGEVVMPRLGNGPPFFSLSRRRQSANGEFAGVIETSVSPQDFQNFYARLSSNGTNYYALVREDGFFLARYPLTSDIPDRLGAQAKLRKAIMTEPQAGKYTVVSQLDGIPRRIGYRKLVGYPVYLLAGIDTSTVRAEWLSGMAAHLIFGVPATILLFSLTLLALQRSQGLERESKLRAEAEEALLHAQKMEAIGQLTGGVAHDFNNLLTIIIGNLDIAERQLKAGGEKAQTKLETVVKNAMQGARRAASLTSRLLAFSRRQPLDPKPLNAGKLVQGMEDLIRQSLGEAVELEIVNAGGLWQVEADPVQLEATILNLALNARDAMPKGGKLTVETSNAFLDDNYARQGSGVEAGQYVLIAVSDTGSGMGPETVARAFEPFFTTKGAGQGTGLGLSQVYGFVKQSGGHVKIYSEPGEGTTVKLYLPRFLAPAREEGEFEPAAAAGGSGETILVVEDDDDVRGYVADILREANYRVFDARDAARALDIFRRHGEEIDLLLTDVVLPGVNGRTLAEEATARHPRLKVLFMTGYSRNAIVHQGRLDAGVALIQKPLTQASLAAKIREILSRQT